MGYNPLLNRVYWGYNPFTNHLLTSWDIQVCSFLSNGYRLMLPFGGDESRQSLDPDVFWNVSLESDVNINSVIEFES